FDTEFVPEYTFTPHLCLVQVATDEELAVFDPIALDDVRPFWNAILRPDCEVVVHAGKEEMTFCLHQARDLPRNVFDVQIAAGLVGLGYPLSLSNLAQKIVHVHLSSSETRTDWRQRPLSARQLDYALDDVRYLLTIRDRLQRRLDDRGRTDWLREEIDRAAAQVRERETSDRWQRPGGSGGLSPRDLAVLREVALWRLERARQLDKPPKWILRDDLLTELAKRKPRTPGDLASMRGLSIPNNAPWGRELLNAVRRGLDVPEDQCPRNSHRRETPDEQMVLKLLSAAMLRLAEERDVATQLLGANDDLKALLDWERDGRSGDAPKLARGWRADVCGRTLGDLLE
ncbi:MAG: ribonuclease D, partial [Planctomycetia bacterium]